MTDLYLNGDEIENIFKKHIKTTVYSFSIKTLFSERMSRKINYQPYYQRNYVWDTSKATFFIESILLGTDIPPLIFFNNGKDIEVVDGRQRYETIKKFKEGDIKLSSKGLTKLMQLKNFSFNKLDKNVQDIFDDAKIRIFEFEIINEPKLDSVLEDKVKKEIFRRYNSGITPLNKAELDNANYDDDEITNLLKDKIKDNELLHRIGRNFLSKDIISLESDSAKILQFLRKYLILSQFPINTYASGSNRTETIEILYTFINDNTENKQELCDFLIDTLNDTFKVIENFTTDTLKHNKYINECLLWAIFILKEEEIDYSNLYIKENIRKIESMLAKDISVFQAEGSHYYKAVIGRYQKIVESINEIIKFDFSLYFKNDNFTSRIKEIAQNEDDLNLKLDELSSLRVQKPDASLIPVDELINDLESNRYLIRPSYQRQEKINVFKASAIVESIILGINLPPIFIFKNEKGIKEVVDGQQRILSILGFVGKKYLDESGNLIYAKNNSFKLKRLKLLKDDFNNKSYNDLEVAIKDKILDFKLSVIEIDAKLNTNFDPVDLFIRLNNKPYPIKDNSFEMWNSYIDKEVIEKIKLLTNSNIDWFFIKQKNKQSDRMLNEELITILTYLRYNYMKKNKNSLGFYKRAENINCRISDKKAITSLLEKLTVSEIEKIDFIESINYVSKIINILKTKLDSNNLKKSLDLLLNSDSTNYKRYLVNFYLLFEILQRLSTDNLNEISYIQLQEKMNSIREKLNNPFKSTNIENVQDYFIKYLDDLSNI